VFAGFIVTCYITVSWCLLGWVEPTIFSTKHRGEIAFAKASTETRLIATRTDESDRENKENRHRKRGHSIIRGTKHRDSSDISMSRRPPHFPRSPPAGRFSLPTSRLVQLEPTLRRKIRARFRPHVDRLILRERIVFRLVWKHPTSCYIENDSLISIRSWLALALAVASARIARPRNVRDALGKVLEVLRHGASGVRERCAMSGVSLLAAFASMLQVAFRLLSIKREISLVATRRCSVRRSPEKSTAPSSEPFDLFLGTGSVHVVPRLPLSSSIPYHDVGRGSLRKKKKCISISWRFKIQFRSSYFITIIVLYET